MTHVPTPAGPGTPGLGPLGPTPPPPDPLPVTWRLSRWKRIDGLLYAMPFLAFGLWLTDEGYRLEGAVALGVLGFAVALHAWFVLLPGRVHLDAEGIRWGRRRVAWSEVAPFRLHESGVLVHASTVRLPATPEQAELQRVGATRAEAVDVPAWVARVPPWRVVALLNIYRAEAVARDGVDVRAVADGADA